MQWNLCANIRNILISRQKLTTWEWVIDHTVFAPKYFFHVEKKKESLNSDFSNQYEYVNIGKIFSQLFWDNHCFPHHLSWIKIWFIARVNESNKEIPCEISHQPFQENHGIHYHLQTVLNHSLIHCQSKKSQTKIFLWNFISAIPGQSRPSLSSTSWIPTWFIARIKRRLQRSFL